MRANFCFDFVIGVLDHDRNVAKYHTLLGIEPIELAPESLPVPEVRCTVFPLWNLGDRGMVIGPLARVARAVRGLGRVEGARIVIGHAGNPPDTKKPPSARGEPRLRVGSKFEGVVQSEGAGPEDEGTQSLTKSLLGE